MPDRAQACWRGQPLEAVLFDLDGTLLDTLADIRLALNRALAEFHWDTMPESEVRRMIGRGSPMLIERTAVAQGRMPDAATRAGLLERFFHHYGALEESGELSARSYPGVSEALRSLRAAGLRTAVVTNKQERFADRLLRSLHLRPWIDVVVGGDTCERRKPDPQPLEFACERLRAAPEHALMVGDSINDVLAARAARIPVICVPYGYNEGNDPGELPCDALIDDLSQLPPLLLPGPVARAAFRSMERS
ncbi:MAG TPA: phosphoglycolate phosphatase [Steroidobacteraceae bacterium]|nr:phosphoglycolate phosphatase [Steroidobacteraceae bacterium]